MLYVTSLDGLQVEPLVKFNSFEMNQEVNGTFTVSLTSFNVDSNPAHFILNEESIITVDDFEFRVKQIEESQYAKKVTAISTFFDLNDVRRDEMLAGTRTFNEFATFCLGQDTGWFFTTDITESKFIPNFGNANVISLINTLCSVYGCEYEIKPNNHVHFAYQIGGDYDAVYRYKHNVKALSKQIDTTKLKTFIEGYGSGGLYVSYESPNSSTFGIRKADPFIDENISESDTLLAKIKSEIIDYPEASFTLDSVELTDKELGERVWLIYEKLNIEFQTRVLSQIKEFRNGHLVTTKVTLGNVIPKTTNDLLVSQKIQIDENKKEYRSKFEQTNDRITLEVQQIGSSISSLEIRADSIETSVTDLNNNLSSRITQTASEIRSEVSAVKSELEGDISVVSQTATQIQSTVTSQGTTINSLGNRMYSAESSITQQANLISSKVSQTDYNGQQIVSLIEQSPSYITISASKINLVGAVSVLSDISGNLGTITTGNINIYEDIYAGGYLHLRSMGGSSGVNFGGYSSIYDNGGTLTINGGWGLYLNGGAGRVYIDGYTESRTNGLGFGYSASAKRLYVSINGVDQGYLTLT